MSRQQAQTTFLLGTAVKITTILNVDTVTTATITIFDSALTKVVTDAAMTKSANKVYNYVYQSASGDNHGLYIAQITIVNGGFTTVSEEEFAFIKQVGT